MFFKNLKIYQFNQSASLNNLVNSLSGQQFVECGKSEAFSEGFVAPAPGGEMLHHTVLGYTMICFKRQERIVSAKALREAVNEKVAAIEAEQGRKIRRSEKLSISDEIRLDQLPKTLPVSTLTYAYIDAINGLLVIDAASFKQAEALTSALRAAAGGLPVISMTYKGYPGSVMTGWLKDGMPLGFESAGSCELHEVHEEKSVIRCKDMDLYSDEVRSHVDSGMEVKRLSIHWREQISCNLDAFDEAFSVSRLKFTDELLSSVDQDIETAMQQFDADFSLMTSALAVFLEELKGCFWRWEI